MSPVSRGSAGVYLACPLLSAPEELDAVALPIIEGSVFTKSATFAVPEV